MTASTRSNRCTSCSAPLAHDQRYCVECGKRRGPLPSYAAGLIAGILERGRSDLPPRPAPLAGLAAAPERTGGGWLLSPRTAALAVMGMLAFGAEIGAVVGATGGAALASAPIVVVKSSPPRATTTTPTTVASAQSTPATTTIVQTVTVGGGATAPSGGSSGSSGSGGSASPASSQTTTPTSTPTSPSNTNPYGLPAIKHVFVVMLSDLGYSQSFGSQDSYLAQTLPKQGKLFEYDYGVAGGELANQIALVSGQGPTPQTNADCSTYANLTPGTRAKHQQVLGQGCVYPHSTQTLPNQLAAAHLTWKAYIQGMANGQPGQPQTCRHPTVGGTDPNSAPQPGDPYQTWRNPFVYFHSLTSGKACSKDDVDLTQLATDLTNASHTPNLSYIVPDACDDGSSQPCTPTAQSGVVAADSFLQSLVTEIKSSAAYQEGGLIVITSDEAPQTGPNADPSGCCATPAYPNLVATSPTSTNTPTSPSTTTSPTTTTTPPTTATSPTTSTSASTPVTSPTSASGGQGQVTPTGGGGQVGMLLISPWIKAGTLDAIDYYNHFALLKSIEDIFNLKHLGYAKQSDLPALDSSTFDGKGPSTG